MENVKLLAEEHGCRMGLLGNMLITVFDSTGKMEQLELIERIQDPIVKEQPKLISLTVIQAVKLSTPSDAFRDASAKLQARYADNVICSAIVVAATGLSAVIARSFLAAYQLMVKPKAPQQTFRDIKSAVEWIQKTAPQASALVGVTPAVEAFAAKK